VTSNNHSTALGEPGVRFGVANGSLVAALFVAAAARLDVGETELFAVIVAGLACVGLSVVLTAWVGVVAWALFTGFVENDYGTLTFDQHDLLRLAVFALGTVALAGCLHHTWTVAKENARE
jgi:hypothetical protein